MWDRAPSGSCVRVTVGKGPKTCLPPKQTAQAALGTGSQGLGAHNCWGGGGARGSGGGARAGAVAGGGGPHGPGAGPAEGGFESARAGAGSAGRARRFRRGRCRSPAGALRVRAGVPGALGQRVACPACHQGKGGLACQLLCRDRDLGCGPHAARAEQRSTWRAWAWLWVGGVPSVGPRVERGPGQPGFWA